VTNPNYDTFGAKETSMVEQLFGDHIYGQSVKNIHAPQKNSIGYKILANLKADEEAKKKLDIETAKRKTFSSQPFKEQSYLKFSDLKQHKEDFTGLGYDPNNAAGSLTIDDELEEEFNKRIKRLANISDEVKIGQASTQNKMMFGQIQDDEQENCE
jgi:hypothetical protein